MRRRELSFSLQKRDGLFTVSLPHSQNDSQTPVPKEIEQQLMFVRVVCKTPTLRVSLGPNSHTHTHIKHQLSSAEAGCLWNISVDYLAVVSLLANNSSSSSSSSTIFTQTPSRWWLTRKTPTSPLAVFHLEGSRRKKSNNDWRPE